MIRVEEDVWLDLAKIVELLRASNVTVLSNDRAEINLHIAYIDRVTAKGIADCLEAACVPNTKR